MIQVIMRVESIEHNDEEEVVLIQFDEQVSLSHKLIIKAMKTDDNIFHIVGNINLLCTDRRTVKIPKICRGTATDPENLIFDTIIF